MIFRENPSQAMAKIPQVALSMKLHKQIGGLLFSLAL